MTFGAFMDMYDDWNGTLCINDRKGLLLMKGNTAKVMWMVNDGFLNYLKDLQVVSFGFYDEEICVMIDYPGEEG